MRLDGIWLRCPDEIVRPIMPGELRCGDGDWTPVQFQVDTGADRTVLDAGTLSVLGLQLLQPTELLGGVGGRADSVNVETQLRFKTTDSTTILINARLAAFTNPDALDMSVLGRDITNLFAVIVDRPGDVVSLPAQQHRYVIQKV